MFPGVNPPVTRQKPVCLPVHNVFHAHRNYLLLLPVRGSEHPACIFLFSAHPHCLCVFGTCFTLYSSSAISLSKHTLTSMSCSCFSSMSHFKPAFTFLTSHSEFHPIPDPPIHPEIGPWQPQRISSAMPSRLLLYFYCTKLYIAFGGVGVSVSSMALSSYPLVLTLSQNDHLFFPYISLRPLMISLPSPLIHISASSRTFVVPLVLLGRLYLTSVHLLSTCLPLHLHPLPFHPLPTHPHPQSQPPLTIPPSLPTPTTSPKPATGIHKIHPPWCFSSPGLPYP